MIDGLIGLVVLVIIVGIVAYLCTLLVGMLPLDARFKQIANVLIMLIAVLIILARALPLLGVAV